MKIYLKPCVCKCVKVRLLKDRIFGGYYAECDKCKKSTTIMRTQEEAIKEWNNE